MEDRILLAMGASLAAGFLLWAGGNVVRWIAPAPPPVECTTDADARLNVLVDMLENVGQREARACLREYGQDVTVDDLPAVWECTLFATLDEVRSLARAAKGE